MHRCPSPANLFISVALLSLCDHLRPSLASFVISGRLTNDHAHAGPFLPLYASLSLSVDVNLFPSQSISDHHHPSVFNPSSPISFHSLQPHLCHFMFVYLLVLFSIYEHDHACFSVSVQCPPLSFMYCCLLVLFFIHDHEFDRACLSVSVQFESLSQNCESIPPASSLITSIILYSWLS